MSNTFHHSKICSSKSSKNFFSTHFSINWTNSKTFSLFTTKILSSQLFVRLPLSRHQRTHKYILSLCLYETGWWNQWVEGEILWISCVSVEHEKVYFMNIKFLVVGVGSHILCIFGVSHMSIKLWALGSCVWKFEYQCNLNWLLHACDAWKFFKYCFVQ